MPDGWVISARPAHLALVSEADFIAAQAIKAARGPAPSSDACLTAAGRRYLPAGLLTCGRCGRRMESACSNGKPAYGGDTATPALLDLILPGRGTLTSARKSPWRSCLSCGVS